MVVVFVASQFNSFVVPLVVVMVVVLPARRVVLLRPTTQLAGKARQAALINGPPTMLFEGHQEDQAATSGTLEGHLRGAADFLVCCLSQGCQAAELAAHNTQTARRQVRVSGDKSIPANGDD